MKQLLFIDTCTPRPYSLETLQKEAMGGTEATVVRIAEALGKDFQVTVMQSPRRKTEASKSVTYSPLKNYALYSREHAVVALRDPEVALGLKKFKPDTNVYLWLHDWLGREFVDYGPQLKKAGVRCIVVSDTHKTQAVTALQGREGPPISIIYNPIDQMLEKDQTPVNKDKLVFFSSPHKGLDVTVNAFRKLREFNPKFELVVGNPGYMDNPIAQEPGVTVLGKLPHHEILKHVRESLCVFYPNTVFPETFGLVFAEANAVGTPVVAHKFGAAHEVLSDLRQLTDCKNVQNIVDLVMGWYKTQRPFVQALPQFRIDNVAKVWRTLLV